MEQTVVELAYETSDGILNAANHVELAYETLNDTLNAANCC